MRAKSIVAFVFLCAGASVAAVFFFDSALDHSLYGIGAEASPVIFLAASIAIFFRPRLGYWLGLAGGLIALPYFVGLKIGFYQSDLVSLKSWNSWLLLNCFGTAVDCWVPVSIRFTLLVFVFVPISVACAVLRLLSARWTFSGSPVCQRLWPAFAVSLLGLAIWFVYSVSPYRLPMSHDGVVADLRILHVEKRGLRFHETCVFETFQYGHVMTSRVSRRWFQYEFHEQGGIAIASPILAERARALVLAANGWNLHTEPPKALWSWNAEGWYLVTPERRFSFTKGEPPEDVKALFYELERAPVLGGTSVRDACFGFCYDPPAALGLSSLSARSWLLRAQ